MQTAFLPVSLCDKIDRKIRNFIWGSSEGNRRIHNVNWETVCRPKNLGGLGLRNARDLNKAFLMKLVWSLVSRSEELWAKVLITKYMTRTENGYMLARKKGFSNAWRGIMKVWDHAHNGIHWSIRDGRNTEVPGRIGGSIAELFLLTTPSVCRELTLPFLFLISV
ncbi:Putative ribonuclease H protein At1g65750 [Linum perenne]